LQQIGQALEHKVRIEVVLADAGYGKGTQFRTDLTQLGLQYVVGIESNATVWGQDSNPYRRPRGSQAGEHLLSVYGAMRIINPFR